MDGVRICAFCVHPAVNVTLVAYLLFSISWISRMKKLLIANRGEIACRIIESCRARNVATVAIYSEADQHSRHVSLADEAHAVGPSAPRESYLVAEKILAAARASEADGIHPGYGFLSENADFAQAVEAAGLRWVGPTAVSITEMGDKERARGLAKAAKVPVLPGSDRFTIGQLDGLYEAAAAVGFPLLVKASAGGGGIGMRRVDALEDLEQVAIATQSMADKAFGDSSIYLERYVANARHVEVQVFGDGEGGAIHLSERDCSVQRRFQKVIEESPAPGLPTSVRDEMTAAALRLCTQQSYRGAGTIEFVVDADSFEFFFLEMNTRIQVEHPVTEMCTNRDLVGMQIDLASGTYRPIAQGDIQHRGHSIECRLYAENPRKNFMPSPGKLEQFTLPEAGPLDSGTVRVDTGFRAGDEVTFFYDPMLAKIVTHAEDRASAIGCMRSALQCIEVEGIHTNTDFLIACMDNETFRAGKVSTGFIDAERAVLLPKKK